MNEDKIKLFLENKELSIDSIFNEIFELYGIDELSRLLNLPCSLFEDIDQETEFNKLLFFDENDINVDLLDEDNMQSYQKQITSQIQSKIKTMRKPTDQQINAMKQKQLQINQQLQNELYKNINNSKNNNYCINAAKNPNEYMKQNINSIQAIPKDMRQNIINPQPIETKKGLFESMRQFYMKFIKVNIWCTWISLAGGFVTGTWSSWGATKMNLGVNQTMVNGVLTNVNSVERIIPFSLLGNCIFMVLKCIDFFTGSKLSTMMDVQEREIGGMKIPVANGGIGLFRISMALMIIFTVIPMIKQWNKKNKEKLKQEYAQTHQMIKEDITDDMLYEKNMEYYNDMKLLDEQLNEFEILNEGLFDFIKRIIPTPKNLLRLVNKGFLILARFAKIIEEGLKINSMSPFMAQFYNIVLCIGNLTLTIAKGILLPLAGITGTDTQQMEAQHIQQKEAIQNGGN